MKAIVVLLVLLNSHVLNAQNPLIVQSVGTTVLEPSNTNDTENWKYNEWNGKRFYQGTGTPTKLCVTDGTTAGTVYVADIGTGDLVHTIPAQDFMYLIVKRFASVSPTFIIEDQIWKSDGTAAGTSLIITMPQAPLVNSGTYTSNATSKQNFAVVGNKMFFAGYDAANGNELWSTNGTTATTGIVKDIKPGSGHGSPFAFCKLNNEIYFSAQQTASDRKLWKTDGTAAGTVQVPVPEPFLFVFPFIGVVNNKMIFYGTNSTDGYEPYVSDGTGAGTFMLANINPTGNSHTGITENVQFKFNSRYCFFISTNGINKALVPYSSLPMQKM
jgi:ELWxxDGT repeat protein